MLEIQKYLSAHSLEELKEEYDINSNPHPTLPIFKLNYGIDSPKLNPITRECRSLTLDKDNNLISRAFPRFFNLHEALEINDTFNWGEFSANEKTDGWICVLFWYNNQWVISSRSSFGDNPIDGTDLKFKDVVLRGIDEGKLSLLDKKLSYVFEICSPYTKIVRQYKDVSCYLLTAYRGEMEMTDSFCDNAARILDCPRPEKYNFNSASEVFNFIKHKEAIDKTFEGVVLRDSNNLRIKVKSSTYVALHRLRGEGNNIISPKYIIPLILSGESEEILSYWSEFQDHFDKVRDRLELHEQRLCDLWDVVKDIEDQKDFALRIQNETPFTGLLFNCRKRGLNPKEVWKENGDMIYKVLYDSRKTKTPL